MRTKIQTSVADMDAVALQQSAYTLKGSAFVIGARAAAEAARELETIAKSGRLEGARSALDHLDGELKRLSAAVLELRENFEDAGRLSGR